MIKREYYRTREDGRRLIHIYSDIGKFIKQIETGIIYEDVIDFEDTIYTYEETEEESEVVE